MQLVAQTRTASSGVSGVIEYCQFVRYVLVPGTDVSACFDFRGAVHILIVQLALMRSREIW